MASSACPFCNQYYPLSELERHANDHLVEEEFQRDLELAHHLAVAPTSPIAITKSNSRDASCSEFVYGGSSGVTASTSDHRKEHIHEKISCLFLLQLRSTFHKVEGGLMTLLRRCLELEGGNSVNIIIDNIDHFQSLESEDAGWGCGWRNIQMLSSHLLMRRPEARDVLFGGSGFVPDIPSLQRWLEIAWERGFDTSGSYDFDKRVYGLTKWIGTTECATLFRSFGLRARVVDFELLANGTEKYCKGKKRAFEASGPMDKFLLNRRFSQEDVHGCGKSEHGTIHNGGFSGAFVLKNNNMSTDPGMQNTSTPRKVEGHQILMEWVWNYFAEKNSNDNLQRVTVSAKTPLYFQHAGHSRTIVGIQVKQQRGKPKEYTLLVLDPGHRTEALERSLRQKVGWQKHIKRGIHTLKKPQYQLCYIDPGIAHGKEMEQLKTIDGILLES